MPMEASNEHFNAGEEDMNDPDDEETFGIFQFLTSYRLQFEEVVIPDFHHCETLPLDEAVALLDGSKDLTGMMLWPGAIMCGEFIISNRHIFKDKTVLELGSGAGLSGLVLANVCKSCILTDKNRDVLNLIALNIQKNLQDGQKCQSSRLMWGKDLDKFVEKFPDIEVIIGCDIVYNRELIPLLLSTVQYILAGKRDAKFIVVYDPGFEQAEWELFKLAPKYGMRQTFTERGRDRKTIIFSVQHVNK